MFFLKEWTFPENVNIFWKSEYFLKEGIFSHRLNIFWKSELFRCNLDFGERQRPRQLDWAVALRQRKENVFERCILTFVHDNAHCDLKCGLQNVLSKSAAATWWTDPLHFFLGHLTSSRMMWCGFQLRRVTLHLNPSPLMQMHSVLFLFLIYRLVVYQEGQAWSHLCLTRVILGDILLESRLHRIWQVINYAWAESAFSGKWHLFDKTTSNIK